MPNAVSAQDTADFGLTASGNDDPSGITWDGTYFRVVDEDDRVYTYNGSGTHVSGQDFALAAGNNHPKGITWDGTYLRVVDDDDNEVYTYTSGGTHVSGQDFTLASTNGKATGITWDGTYFRVIDITNTLALAYDSSGSHVIGKDIDISSPTQQLNGITWDGTYLRVVRKSSNPDIISYDSSGDHISGQDFDLVDGHNGPRGVTWDGTYFRVVGENDVYAYNLATVRDSLTHTPDAPTRLNATRSDNYGVATIIWDAPDQIVSEYEIERLEALTVSSEDLSRIEYGNLVRTNVEGSFVPVTEYEDDTVQTGRTYRYRIRAQGGEDNWSGWTGYIASGGQQDMSTDAPANVQVARSEGNDEITISWTAPDGEFDNYTVQRQQLFQESGSSFFAETTTLGGVDWLPPDSTTYTDLAIIAGRTYEYRVAAVKDDVVGDYSDWFRSVRTDTSLGDAPENLRLGDSTQMDDRREAWLAWDAVDGVDDYEVQVASIDERTGASSVVNRVYTDTMYFHTGFERAQVRVRGRLSDADQCGSGANDYCYTEWSGWFQLGFRGRPTIAQPAPLDTVPTPEPEVLELRADMEEVLEAGLSPIGATPATGTLINMMVLGAGFVPAGLTIFRAKRSGMLALGSGMALSVFVIILALGVRLLEVPEAWLIAILVLLVVGGGLAAVKVLGLFGGK